MSDSSTPTPIEKSEAKADRYKLALRRSTLALLDQGGRFGLPPADVQTLRSSLEALGWMPVDLSETRQPG